MKTKRAGFIGVGEVILEYAYHGFMNLEQQGVVEITAIAGRGDKAERIRKLEERRRKYPKQKKSIDNLLEKLDSGKVENFNTEAGYFSRKDEQRFFDKVDFVYLATPNNLREDFVKQIAQAGKPVILEKPIAHTLGTANRIVGILRKEDIKAICAEHYLYKSPSLEFFKNYDEKTKEFGSIQSIEGILEENDFLKAERCSWLLDPSVSGGGVWLDLGIHMMHLAHTTGVRLKKLIDGFSYVYKFPTGDKRNNIAKSETGADVFFFLQEDGRSRRSVSQNAYGHIRVAKCKPEPIKQFRIGFDRGDVILDFLENSITYVNRNGGSSETKKLQKTEPYENMINAFISYLDNGTKPHTTLEAVKETTEDIFKVYREMQKEDWRQFY